MFTSRLIDFSPDFLCGVNFNAEASAVVAKLAASAACFILPNINLTQQNVDALWKKQEDPSREGTAGYGFQSVDDFSPSYNLKSKMLWDSYGVIVEHTRGLDEKLLNLIGANRVSEQITSIFPITEANKLGRIAPFFPIEVFETTRYSPVHRLQALMKRGINQGKIDVKRMLIVTRSAQVFVSVFRFLFLEDPKYTAQRDAANVAMRLAATKYWKSVEEEYNAKTSR